MRGVRAAARGKGERVIQRIVQVNEHREARQCVNIRCHNHLIRWDLEVVVKLHVKPRCGGGVVIMGSCCIIQIAPTCVLKWSDIIHTCSPCNLVGTCTANYPAIASSSYISIALALWWRCTHHFIHSFTGQGRGRREYGWYRDMYKKNDVMGWICCEW